jgi:hypothetical protein
VHQEELVLAVLSEDERRIVALVGSASDVVVEPEGVLVERDRFVDVVDGDLELHRPAVGRGGHGESSLQVVVEVADLTRHEALASFEATAMAEEDLVDRVPAVDAERGADVLHREVDPPQRLDEAGVVQLLASVAPVTAVVVDLGRPQDADVVVVA